MTRRLVGLVALLLLALSLSGQEAKVKVLVPEDVTRAQLAYQKLKASQAEYDQVRRDVTKKYLSDNIDGWENGFEFTPDFKFIVPQASPVIKLNNGCYWNYGAVPVANQ